MEETLRKFHGTIQQVPPAFSAVKIDGQRAYKMARKGQTPELKAKTLVIDDIELLEYAQDQISLRIVCSKGTYIRALARDIGEALGSGAHLTALRRTRVGDFTIDKCISVDDAAAMIRDVDITMPDDNADSAQQ